MRKSTYDHFRSCASFVNAGEKLNPSFFVWLKNSGFAILCTRGFLPENREEARNRIPRELWLPLVASRFACDRFESSPFNVLYFKEPGNKATVVSPRTLYQYHKMATKRLQQSIYRFVVTRFVPPSSAPKVVAPKGVVLLNAPPIADKTPNVSNFVLKLETYLRMADIPYLNNYTFKLSSKGKVPWIEYNGKKIADSNFCISFLEKEFNVDLEKNLTPKDKAVSRAVLRMVEENLYWTMVYYRWVEHAPATMKLFVPNAAPWVRDMMTKTFQQGIKAQLKGHGMGRHKKDEVYSIAHQDICAISGILGEKPYMMGKEPTVLDSTVFGAVAQALWQDIDSLPSKALRNEFTNLVTHSERMKERFWPDWEEMIAQRKQYHLGK